MSLSSLTVRLSMFVALFAVGTADLGTRSDGPCSCPGLAEQSDAVVEAQQVTILSDRIEQAEIMLKSWRLKAERAKEYHDKQVHLLNNQMRAQEELKAARDAQSPRGDEYYTHAMCAKVANAYVLGDKEAEMELKHLCFGREDLALTSKGLHPHCICALQMATTKVSQKFSQRHNSLRAGDSPMTPVQNLEAKLKTIQDEIVAARQQYFDDSDEQSAERQSLAASEDELGNSTSGSAATRLQEQSAAWQRVKEVMCAKITPLFGMAFLEIENGTSTAGSDQRSAAIDQVLQSCAIEEV